MRVEWFLDVDLAGDQGARSGRPFFAIGQRPSPRVLEAAVADPAVEAPGFVAGRASLGGAKSAVYVVPLRVGGGTRLKMVDAMAQGKAIVATTLGAEGIEGEDGRHFMLADAPEAFADGHRRCCATPGAAAARRRGAGAAP